MRQAQTPLQTLCALLSLTPDRICRDKYRATPLIALFRRDAITPDRSSRPDLVLMRQYRRPPIAEILILLWMVEHCEIKDHLCFVVYREHLRRSPPWHGFAAVELAICDSELNGYR